ncbi:sensor histidine kinase [Streptomyces aidingensis]|uniref:histidine kinase n=1 Tax=Streptomyces aidingensis TaxID=910347 RepID=A0A1I1UFH3_9ACTN|nr:HAMP domain-containing sensor histidine kinase [Streptomyces aidingensis]SFD69596.1 Signal transduction histidine kinase [Streptomyces aidingensis]
MQTIRFRLAVTYSAVLFGVAALVVTAVYLVLSATLHAEPLNPVEVSHVWRNSEGLWEIKEDSTFRAADFEGVENAVNHKTLGMLRTLSLQAIAVLFVAGLVTGWWLSGRALRPVRRITETAREISATDLSRRIALAGPQDELRMLADTLDSMLDRLDEAFSTQRRIVGDASHELLNPLAVIRANVEAVLALDHVDPRERARASTVVVRATGRMTRLIEDLLASARRASPAFVDQDVDLASVAEEVCDEYAQAAKDRGLRLERRLAPGPVVAGDPRALARAVDNLLSNAVRLAPAGSAVTVACGTRRGWCWAAVRDQGPGIAREDHERIFTRFFSGSGGTTAGHSGLGLAIVRQIAEAHDGTVAVHSRPGTGSTFVLWFPDRAAPADRAPRPPAGAPLPPGPAFRPAFGAGA